MFSAIKNFFVTLLIAAAIFGVAAYFATKFVTATVSDIMDNEENALEHIGEDAESDSSQESSTGEDDPNQSQTDEKTEGESFSFVVVTSGYRPDLFGDYKPTIEELQDQVASFSTAADSFGILSDRYREQKATSITLVRVDKENKQVTYTYLTPETRVLTDSGYHTLGEVYTYYGYARMGECVRSLTGIAVDYVFLLEGYNFDEFLDAFGTVWVNNPKKIYSDGIYHTTRSETTKERLDEDGNTVVDHYANSYVLTSGSIEFNMYSSNILNTLKELSSPDIQTKGAYTLDIVQAYMAKLSAMEEDAFRSLMETVLILPVEENVGENDVDLSDIIPQTEPNTPVLEGNFMVDEIEEVYPLIQASASYAVLEIEYPGNFVTATENTEAYFAPDLDKAIKRFLPYRFPVEANS